MTQIYFVLSLFLAIFAAAIIFLVRTYRRDRSRERARTRDALSRTVRAELDAEAAAYVARKSHFEAALTHAEQLLPRPTGAAERDTPTS